MGESVSVELSQGKPRKGPEKLPHNTTINCRVTLTINIIAKHINAMQIIESRQAFACVPCHASGM